MAGIVVLTVASRRDADEIDYSEIGPADRREKIAGRLALAASVA